MKTLAIIIGLLISTQSFALTLDLNRNELNPEIVKYLETKLVRCTLDIGNEVFKLEKLEVVNDRVDNGIVDRYYTMEFSYDAVRNDVISNDITVKVVDSDFNNYRNYSERLTFEVVQDRNNFCQ